MASRTASRTAAPPGYAKIHGGDASAVLVPTLGGKVREMNLGGRQWLWHDGESGGFDERFPTAAACRLPRWVAGARRARLPDHGELAAQSPAVAIVTDQDGHSATCTWNGAALPYRFTRRITVHPEGWVAFAYSATNTGEHRMPFLWSSHPLFPLTARTRIVLPEGARTRVCAQRGVDFGKRSIEHTWPRLRTREKIVDLSHPFAAMGDDYACKLFVELPRREVTVVVEEGPARLEMHMHGREIPTVGISINRRTKLPSAMRQRFWPSARQARPACTLAIEPCLGAPESLSDALGEWDDAHWLEPGATARWGMTWRGARQPADAPGEMADVR